MTAPGPLAYFRPSRTVPVTRWRSTSRWRTGPWPLVAVLAGQWVFGTGEAFLVAAGLGVSPWTVLAQGIAVRTGIAIGLATFAVSAVVLLLWIPLRERPGLGTMCNMIVIATALQVMVGVLPHPANLGVCLAFVLVGITLIGLGSGFYLTANLGPGPRDGWMTGLHMRFGWPVVGVRLAIEATVLVLGWLLGGTVGIGTVLFALLIGPAVGYGLRVAGWLGRTQTPELAIEDDQHPELEA